MTVCRLEKYKGIHYLIQALPKLSDDIVLEIVGKGPYKNDLIELTKKLNVSKRVCFFENLPWSDLLQKYADADLFGLLSEHESYGMTVGEALCAGTPCLVATKSALAEWVDNANCFGIDYPIQVDRLVKLIQEIISKRISLIVAKLWSWEDVVTRIAALYDEPT